ncbi:ubiquitin 3 binding protein But2 C-terminal domain-containing protein [Xylaria nigripes]|nr:ubiquitin 3 binding protein But2 C-terminal domain-containing protein [Xylaria nigripes]
MFVTLIPLLSVFWVHSLNIVEAQPADGNVGCAFHLSCSGAFNGSIGEKSSGQARASSDVLPTLFTWFGDAFADQQGNGCWWTPPTFTLQCDKNQAPDHGFQIGCDGLLSFNGQSVFYECPTGAGDEVNLYLRSNGDQCHEITIQADSCTSSTCPGGGGGAGPGPGQTNSPTSSTVTTPSTLATSSTTSTSPTTATLSTSATPSTSEGPPIPLPFTTGNDKTTTTSTSTSTVTTTQPAATPSDCIEVEPDEIILTDQGNPDTAYGPNEGKHIQISPNASSIFNFHFDDTDIGKTCELSFRITHGLPFNLTGTGIATLTALDDVAAANTTYNTMPRAIETIDNVLLYEGMQHGFGAFPCPGSSSHGGVLLGEAPMADTCLDCMQGNGMGMFLRKC